MLPRKIFANSVYQLSRDAVRRTRYQQLSLCNSQLNQKEEEEIEQNPYFEKYADKIKKVQKEQKQFTTPKPKGDSRLRRETEQWKRTIQSVEKKFSEKKREQDNRRGSKLPSTLGELIHVELLESKSSEEVAVIWTEHFKDKDAISAVIPSDLYDEMLKRVKAYPTFLYPLPKDQGYEFILSQFEGNRCFFTSLINFQVHGENAPWQLCMTFYPELKDNKGIALMTSEIDQNTMNLFEAQCLAQLQKLFYVTPDKKKLELLETFTKKPDSFKYMDLVRELEGSNMVVKKTE